MKRFWVVVNPAGEGYIIHDFATGRFVRVCPDPEAIPNVEAMQEHIAGMEEGDILGDYFSDIDDYFPGCFVDHPLTEMQTKACINKDEKLDAVLRMSLSEIVDLEGVEPLNLLVEDYFDGCILSNIQYHLVGFEPGPSNDADCVRGSLRIRVLADAE